MALAAEEGCILEEGVGRRKESGLSCGWRWERRAWSTRGLRKGGLEAESPSLRLRGGEGKVGLAQEGF